MPTKLPSRIGRFEVVDRIGQGGMGILYLARDPVLERSVAIKVLSVHNEELLERFGREARSVASLKHHHIVTIYDIGEDHGNPFIAMEYIDGETLAEVIKRKHPLGLGRKFELILQLCDGLGYAHRAGIIHRDIKPANLMITSDGVLKILDFGLARLAADETMGGLTVAGAILGTPHYMSPEQIEGQRIDHRSDIFAVGLVIYELLTYCKAYPGDSPHSVLQKVLHTEPLPMRDLQEGIDPELERLVSHAIEKAPDSRYQQLAFLATDLSRIRDRLQMTASEPTVRFESARPKSAASGGLTTPSPTPGQIPNLDALARRRTAKIDAHLKEALQHFQGGRFEEAIEQCELAVLVDPSNVRALDLLKSAHRAVEDRQIRAWLEEAQTNLSHSALSAAAVLIEKALQLRPGSPEAQLLQRTLQDRRREQERARERVRSVRAAIDRALANFRDGALEAAVRSTAEALSLDPDNEEARALRHQVTQALEERRRKQELDEKATAAVSAARHHASVGDYQRGLRLLKAFSAPHPLVHDAATEIAAEAARADQRARSEEEARQRARLEEEANERARADVQATQQFLLKEEERRQLAEQAARERDEARRRRDEMDSRARRDRLTAGKTAARDALSAGRFAEALEALQQARIAVPSDAEIDEIEEEIASARLAAEESAASILEPAIDEGADPAPAQQSSAGRAKDRKASAPSRRAYLLVASAIAVVIVLALAGRALWPAPSTTSTSVSGKPADPPIPPAASVPVPVMINAIPWANVRIVPKNGGGGATEGTTPLVVQLQEGEYTLELRNELFQATSQNLTVGKDPQSVSVVMPGADVDTIVTEVLGPAQ